MKILLLGEYSNLHNCIAQAFRQLGHETLLISNGDFWKNYPADIRLDRETGFFPTMKYLARIAALLPSLRGYDIVQLINPLFFELKAEHIRPIYNYLRRHNKIIVLGAFGNDYYWMNTNVEEKPLRYSDFNIGNQLRNDAPALELRKEWAKGTHKQELNTLIAQTCDHIVTCLYEYDVVYRMHFPEKTTFIPLPIDAELIQPEKQLTTTPSPIDVFIGINKTRSAYKGTDIMLRAAEYIAKLHPDKIRLSVAQSVPYAQYKKMLTEATVLLDQLYSYTPSMNSLTAMARGTIVVGGAEPENYQIIGEENLRPILNVQPVQESVEQQLLYLINNPQSIPKLSRESIEYVEKHHHQMKVARQYLQLYQKLLEQKGNDKIENK